MSAQNTYVIQNENDFSLLWSNTHGWIDDDDFDVFTLQESETLTLPIEGRWIQLVTM
jgi:hypothetical protein